MKHQVSHVAKGPHLSYAYICTKLTSFHLN